MNARTKDDRVRVGKIKSATATTLQQLECLFTLTFKYFIKPLLWRTTASAIESRLFLNALAMWWCWMLASMAQHSAVIYIQAQFFIQRVLCEDYNQEARI